MIRNAVRRLVAVLAVLLAGLALHTGLIGLIGGDTMFAGSRPADLGFHAGRLAAPKKTPNCVSSQAGPSDVQHYVAPIRFDGGAAAAMAALRTVVAGMPGSTIVRQQPDYLYAEFRSRLMGFVDDVEFGLSEKDGFIQVRSASRLGRRDFGINRERIESVRARFAAAQAAAAKP